MHARTHARTYTHIHARAHARIYACIHNIIMCLYVTCRKINNTVEQILKYFQSKDKRRKASQKPTLLPIATVEEMINFENIDDETYKEVVH